MQLPRVYSQVSLTWATDQMPESILIGVPALLQTPTQWNKGKCRVAKIIYILQALLTDCAVPALHILYHHVTHPSTDRLLFFVNHLSLWLQSEAWVPS